MIFITVYDDCHFDWFMMDSKLVFKSWIIIPIYDYITGVNRVIKGRLEPWNYLVCKTILGKHVRYTILLKNQLNVLTLESLMWSHKKKRCVHLYSYFLFIVNLDKKKSWHTTITRQIPSNVIFGPKTLIDVELFCMFKGRSPQCHYSAVQSLHF